MADLRLSNQERNRKIFEILVRKYHRRLMAFAISLCGDEDLSRDLVQEGFVTAYRKLDQFDTSRDFGAWMRGIVRNKYREWCRRRREKTLSHDLLEAIESRHREWEEADEETGSDLFKALRSCLEYLSGTARRVVQGFYFQRQPAVAIAEGMGRSEPVVRKILQRTREHLADCVDRKLKRRD